MKLFISALLIILFSGCSSAPLLGDLPTQELCYQLGYFSANSNKSDVRLILDELIKREEDIRSPSCVILQDTGAYKVIR